MESGSELDVLHTLTRTAYSSRSTGHLFCPSICVEVCFEVVNLDPLWKICTFQPVSSVVHPGHGRPQPTES